MKLSTRKKASIAGGIVLALVVVGILLAWTKPWTLFTTVQVNEVSAVDEYLSTSPTPPTTDEPEVAAPVLAYDGVFQSQGNYSVEGTVTIIELPDGQQILTLDGFKSTNGPDLQVVLATDAGNVKQGQHLSLGALKGNEGTQNYEIPAGVDVSAFTLISIWCDDFASPFGYADLVKPS